MEPLRLGANRQSVPFFLDPKLTLVRLNRHNAMHLEPPKFILLKLRKVMDVGRCRGWSGPRSCSCSTTSGSFCLWHGELKPYMYKAPADSVKKWSENHTTKAR